MENENLPIQAKIANLEKYIHDQQQRMVMVAANIESLRVLTHLECDGQRPDFSTLSDQQVTQLYDLGMTNRGINQLDHVHPHSMDSIKTEQSKPLAEQRPPLTRKEMETALDDALKARGYKINTVQIAAAQVETAEGLSRDMGGKYDAANQDLMNIREQAEAEGLELDPAHLKGQLSAYGTQLIEFQNSSKVVINEMASRPGRLELEALSRRDHRPQDVQNSIDRIKDTMGARQLDLRGLDMTQLKTEGVRFKGCTVDPYMVGKQLADIQQGILAEMERLKEPVPNLERLSKLSQEGGRVPDLQQLDRQDLVAAFAHVLKSPNHQYNLLPDEDPFACSNLQNASAADFTSEEIRDGLGRALNECRQQGMPLNDVRMVRIQKGEVSELQNTVASNLKDVTLEYENLKATYPDAQSPVIDNLLQEHGRDVSRFIAAGANERVAKLGGEMITRQLNRLGPDHTPDDVTTCLTNLTNNVAMDASERFPLKDIQPGLDVTGVNLARFNIGAETLSNCRGVEQVQGVPETIKNQALNIQTAQVKVADLAARVDKLEHTSALAGLKYAPQGGLKAVKEQAREDLQAAKQELAEIKQTASNYSPAVNPTGMDSQSTYRIGRELSAKTESVVSKEMQATQANETFKVTSMQPMDDQGATVAFGKLPIGAKTEQMKAQGMSPGAVMQKEFQECNNLQNLAHLWGRTEEVGAVVEISVADKKAALGADPTSMLTRSVATSAVDKALGMNAVAEEKFGIAADGTPFGISVGVPGAPIFKRPDEHGGMETFLKVDYAHPQIQKGLFDLQAQDYITGQVDRHGGNIFIDPHTNEVRGIDNDLAFPVIDREEMIQKSAELQAKAAAGLPDYMHADTAKKIEALSPAELRKTLTSIEPPPGVAKMEPAAIEGAVQRLEKLQAHIEVLREKCHVVDQFTPETYKACVDAQKAARPDCPLEQDPFNTPRTSYVGTAAIEQARTASLNAGQVPGRLVATIDDIPKARVNPQFAVYKEGVEASKQALKERPEHIQDADTRTAVESGVEKVKDLETKLVADERVLETTLGRLQEARGNPNTQPELMDVLETSVAEARKNRVETLQQLTTEKKALEQALNKAVEPLKPDIALKAKLIQAGVPDVQISVPQPGENQQWQRVNLAAQKQQRQVSIGDNRVEQAQPSGQVRLKDVVGKLPPPPSPPGAPGSQQAGNVSSGSVEDSLKKQAAVRRPAPQRSGPKLSELAQSLPPPPSPPVPEESKDNSVGAKAGITWKRPTGGPKESKGLQIGSHPSPPAPDPAPSSPRKTL